MNPPVVSQTLLPWWRQPRWWVVAGMFAFTAYFGLFVLFRHANLLSAQFDLGNMDQVLWNSLHGRWFVMTDPLSGIHQVRTAIHADFLLLAYLPFYALWPDPRTLMVLQVIMVGLGALPLYRFGRRYLTDRAAALIGLAYLTYPMLHWATVFDVHAVLLAVPLFLWAVWAAAGRRWLIFAFSIGLALLAKEEIGVTVALLGVFLLFWRRPRWIALATIVAGFGWTAFMLWYAIPAARHIPGHFALSYYSDFGGSTSQVVTGILSHPLQVIQKVFGSEGLHYQFDLLLPLGGLSVLGLPLLIVAAPELLVNVLSSNVNLRSMYFQYTSVLIPFILLSAVFGLHYLQRWLKRFHHAKMIHGVLMTGVIVANLAAVYRWSLLPGTRNHGDAIHPFVTNEYAQEIQTISRQIPKSHAVATTNNIAPHFTQRDYEWSFPRNLDRADDVVVLTGADFEVESKADILHDVQALQQNPEWRLAYQRQALYYFQRVTPPHP